MLNKLKYQKSKNCHFNRVKKQKYDCNLNFKDGQIGPLVLKDVVDSTKRNKVGKRKGKMMFAFGSSFCVSNMSRWKLILRRD